MRRRRLFCLLSLPVVLAILLWMMVAALLACLSPLLVFPVILVERRLEAAIPVVPGRGAARRVAAAAVSLVWAVSAVFRLLTLPLRRSTPSFYIFSPGTMGAVLAHCLTRHPAISGRARAPVWAAV